MTRYEFSYELTSDMLCRAMMSWDAQPRSKAQNRRNFILLTLLYVIVFSGVLALLEHELIRSETLLAAAVGVGAGLVLWVVIHPTSSGRLLHLSRIAIARQGVERAEFDSEKVVFTTDISARCMAWLCFDEVTALTDATVLRAGGIVHPVPDAALPAGVTPQNFRADLTRWREAAA